MTDEIDIVAETKVRNEISEKLAAGLETEAYPRAETSEMVNEFITRLQQEAGDDIDKKLIISGFTNYAVEADDIEQPCETCMYYLSNRKFCELPELMLPVEPEWSCRLWRI
tara:strand:+ start:51796 stop:52128 length:333 start_codon:yes stop_codon:yes gene_type:complete